jgi:hypothetical protein
MWAKLEVEGAELMRSQLNVSFNKLHSSWQELKDSTREYSRHVLKCREPVSFECKA